MMLSLFSPVVFFFFFKQKTAYEMRISDWSSDVCSSDLHQPRDAEVQQHLDFGLPYAGSRRDAGAGAGLHHRRRRRICALRRRIGARYRQVRGAPVLLLRDWHEFLHGDCEAARRARALAPRSEVHTSELLSLIRISSAVFCLKNKTQMSLNLLKRLMAS